MKNTFKKFLSTLLSASLLLTGCTSNSSNSNESSEVTKITFWYANTDKIQENNENLVKKFNETIGKEKGIEVVAEYQGSYNDLHQKLQAAYIASEAPEVSVIEVSSIQTFAESGIILPLDDYIQADNIDISNFYQGLLENCIVNDTIYSLPYLRSTPILYLNTTLLEEAGITQAPTTWEELADYARIVKEKTGKYGFSTYSSSWFLEAFFLQNGSQLLSYDGTYTNLYSDEGLEIFEFFQNMAKDGVAKFVSGDNSSKISADILNQNVAMWLYSTAELTQYLEIAKENNFEISTAFVPQFGNYGVTTGGCNLVITSKLSDEKKAAAWEFLKWMLDTEQAVESTITTGYIPISKTATESDAIQDLFAQNPQFEVALNQLQSYAKGRPMFKKYPEAQTEFINAMDSIWVNLGNISENLEYYSKRVNSILQE